MRLLPRGEYGAFLRSNQDKSSLDSVRCREILDVLGSPPFLTNEADDMTFHFRDLPVKDSAKLVSGFILSILIGASGRLWYSRNWWLHDTAYALADALIVAGVIGLILELFASKFLIERVAGDLAPRLVGRGLPGELQGKIRDIIHTDFVRDHYVKAYSLSDPDETGHVHLDAKITFEVKNYSDSVREYSPFMQEETFYKPEFQYLEYATPERSYSFNAEQLSSMVKISPETKVKEVSGPKKVRLKPYKENSNSKAICRVTMKIRTTMLMEYLDVNNFAAATIGVTLQLDRIPDGFDFRSSGEGMHHDADSSSWYFDGPFLAGQSVRAWWFKKENAVKAE
jgi:hypothetical protein